MALSTGDISLQDICKELYGNAAAGMGLKQCFADAVPEYFHSSFVGNKDRQSNFKGYGPPDLDIRNQYNTGKSEILEPTNGDKQDMVFSSDGKRMFVLLRNGYIQYYNLSRAFDITTSYFVQNYSFTTSSTDARAFYFNPEGTIMYYTEDGSSSNNIKAYRLTVPWTITSLQYTGTLNTGLSNPYGLHVSEDGKQIFVLNFKSGDCKIREFFCPTPWSIVGAYTARTVNLPVTMTHFTFVNDGFKVWFWRSDTKRYEQYLLEIAYRIDTMIGDTLGAVLPYQTRGEYVIPRTNRMIICVEDTNRLYEYTY